MIDAYFLYLIELLHIDDRARELMHNTADDAAPQYLDTDYEGNLFVAKNDTLHKKKREFIVELFFRLLRLGVCQLRRLRYERRRDGGGGEFARP